MLKCPVCGNTEFTVSVGAEQFVCPVAGCGGIVRVKPRGNNGEVRAWVKPAGGNFGWIKNQHDAQQKQETFVFREAPDGWAEVMGVCGELNGEVRVPGLWNGRRVIRIASKVFKGQNKITKIVFAEETEILGRECCAMCENLQEVNFGSNVALIDSHAFLNCVHLSKVKAAQAPLCVIDDAFAGCYSLSKEEISRITSGVC